MRPKVSIASSSANTSGRGPASCPPNVRHYVSIASSSANTSGRAIMAAAAVTIAVSQSLLGQRILPAIRIPRFARWRSHRLNRFFVSEYFRTEHRVFRGHWLTCVSIASSSANTSGRTIRPRVPMIAVGESQSLLRQRILPDRCSSRRVPSTRGPLLP